MDQQLELYEPSSRFGHVSSSVGGQVVVWGGEISEFYSKDGRVKLATIVEQFDPYPDCLLYTSPSPRDATLSRMPSSA